MKRNFMYLFGEYMVEITPQEVDNLDTYVKYEGKYYKSAFTFFHELLHLPIKGISYSTTEYVEDHYEDRSIPQVTLTLDVDTISSKKLTELHAILGDYILAGDPYYEEDGSSGDYLAITFGVERISE